MADVETHKRPNSSRVRKTTPRARPKKTEKSAKQATPRRRASPRNFCKVEKNDEKKQAQVIDIVKEEEEQRQVLSQEDEKTEQLTVAVEELPPAKDPQLRRNYLQRIYRQLQSTHPNQDDNMIRQIATNLEMEACQTSTTRSQYIAAMEHEIHKLMQFEIQQANTSPLFTEVQSPVVSNDMPSGYSQQQISQTRSYEYAQALAKAQSQEQASTGSGSSSFSTPQQSMNGDISFQSLMNSQNSPYGRNNMQQNTPNRGMKMQNLPQMGNPFYSTSSMVPPTTNSQNFSPSNTGIGEMSTQAQQQQTNFPMQQAVRTQSRQATLQEFSAQILHLDKSVLIELLWNQRNALAQWQRRAKHYELQLTSQQNTANNMGSPGFHSPYNSPMVGGGSFVNSNAEAEMQRARNNSRMTQQQMSQYSYTPQPTDSNGKAGATADWGENPQLYWEKIRVMKVSYVEQLRTAQRALAQNTAPPNSLYSLKAQSMMQNIAMVLNILSEQPTNVQPRKFEVLTSIDRFMQMSVTPIVQKVLSTGTLSHMTTKSQTSTLSPGVATSVATYSPGVPSSQDNNGGMNNLRQSTGNQYPGPRWSSPSTSFRGVDNSRQSSRGAFFDLDDKSSVDGHGNDKIDPQTSVLSESPDTVKAEDEAVEFTSMRTDNEDTIVHQEHSTYPYDASKDSYTPVLTSISRPSSITDTPLSPDVTASLSPEGNTRENSSKTMPSSSLTDSLNDFSYFPEMDFDASVPDNSNYVKENNNPANLSRKRRIEDV